MAHRLRRIIGINVFNPSTNLPSARIAKLDVRGSTLAIGANGTGKTSLLRFLPLFQAATPQDILRGTGLPGMIAHTLPDPSSAIAFEYERESEDDLRLVVVHCKANADSPEFCIVKSGFHDKFFVTPDDLYVQRDEFRAHVEAMGVTVTPKMALHQYRSVILNENLRTKDGKEMRRYAAEHSLAPTSLYNLDRLAPAMATERISFGALRGIAIDRITDTGVDGLAGANDKALRKSRKDVTEWLNTHAHIADVLKLEPKAKAMQEAIAGIKDVDLTASKLRIQIKAAISAVESELKSLDEQEAKVKAEFDSNSKALLGEIDKQKLVVTRTVNEWRAVHDWMDNFDRRKAYFEDQGIGAVVAEHEIEDSIGAKAQAVNEELGVITKDQKDIVESHHARVRQIEQAHSDRVNCAHQRKSDIAQELNARLEKLRSAQDAALGQMPVPPRLAQIYAEDTLLAGQEGSIKGQMINPPASPEVLSASTSAKAAVDDAKGELDAAKLQEDGLAKAEKEAKDRTDAANKRVQDLDLEAAQLKDRVDAKRLELTPAPGSLLEFLRASDQSLWREAAKALDHALLNRTDLQPSLDDRKHAGGRVDVGALQLTLSPVAQPSWVSMEEVHAEVTRLERLLHGLRASQAEAAKQATDAAKQFSKAKKLAADALARHSLKVLDHKTALANHERAQSAVEQNIKDIKRKLAEELEANANRRKALSEEARAVQQAHDAGKQQMKAQFQAQSKQINDEHDRQRTHLDAEVREAEEAKQTQLAQADKDRLDALAGKGIDQDRITTLSAESNALSARLRKIETTRHLVESWRDFNQTDVLASPAKREERHQKEIAKKEAEEVQADLSRALEALKQTIKDKAETIHRNRTINERDKSALTSLSGGWISKFISPALGEATVLDVDWTVQGFEKRVDDAKKSLEKRGDALRKMSQEVRDVMRSREGPVSQWLSQREKEMLTDDRMLDHERYCAEATLLCEWFEPRTHRATLSAIHQTMRAFLQQASNFVADVDRFNRRVGEFNRDLQKALGETAHFARFGDLSVKVTSSANRVDAMETLQKMKQAADSRESSHGVFTGMVADLPTDEEVRLIREFRDHLPSEGELRINLNDQVQLECSLTVNDKERVIRSEEEFRSIASNGNTVLITIMFLMGFVHMVRGRSPVRLCWVTDEIGRVDPVNLKALLETLDRHQIDVICAAPSADPMLVRQFERTSFFRDSGDIYTPNKEIDDEDGDHAVQ